MMKITKKIGEVETTIKIQKNLRRYCFEFCEFLEDGKCYLDPIHFKKLDKYRPRTQECVNIFGFIGDDERLDSTSNYEKGYYCNICKVKRNKDELYKGSCYDCAIIIQRELIEAQRDLILTLGGDPDDII